VTEPRDSQSRDDQRERNQRGEDAATDARHSGSHCSICGNALNAAIELGELPLPTPRAEAAAVCKKREKAVWASERP